MSDFYSNKENLVGVLTHWLAIFSEGQPPIVPVMRDESGAIDLEKTMELPCYANFPASELAIWRESWVKPATIGQAPAGEWAQDELLALTGEFTALVANEIEIQRGDWVNAWGVMRKELYSFFKRAYTAGRSSQPAEPRDPAGK